MRIIPPISHSFDLTDSCDEDRAISREEAMALRDIFRDEPYDDEAPELDDAVYGPSLDDETWWAEATRVASEAPSPVKLLDFKHIAPGHSVALVENERPIGASFRYLVIAYEDGTQVDFVGSDSLATAEMILRHTVAPFPVVREGGASW